MKNIRGIISLMWRTILCMLCAAGAARGETKDEALTVKPAREGDAVRISVEGKVATLDVTSLRGIGGATITRKVEKWPEQIVLKVHLRGLESLTITVGKVALRASVLSHSGNTRLLHVVRDGKEGPRLKPGDEMWMEIKVLDSQGKEAKGLPPKEGWFEMSIPAALLAGEEKGLDLHWIDFYR